MNTPEPVAKPTAVGFRILSHHVSDLSVENPVGRVPDASLADIVAHSEVSVATLPLSEEGAWRVDIHLQLAATLGPRTVFLIEMNHRVEVQLTGVPQPVVAHVLEVDVPSLVFPAIKEIVERNGAYAGYPALEMQPVDFRALHYGS